MHVSGISILHCNYNSYIKIFTVTCVYYCLHWQIHVFIFCPSLRCVRLRIEKCHCSHIKASVVLLPIQHCQCMTLPSLSMTCRINIIMADREGVDFHLPFQYALLAYCMYGAGVNC